jgi:DNA-binding NarL/FixJ family response regulator
VVGAVVDIPVLAESVIYCAKSRGGVPVPVKVLLADDTEFVRRAIRRLLEARPEIEIVGEAANFAQTIQMSNDLKPDVIVMDLHMPDGLKIMPLEVKSLLNSGITRLLAISVWQDDDADALAESFGALTLLDKSDLGNKLVPAILATPEHLRTQFPEGDPQ